MIPRRLGTIFTVLRASSALGIDNGAQINLALTLRELGIKSVPVNLLNPIAGTPYAQNEKLSRELSKLLCTRLTPARFNCRNCASSSKPNDTSINRWCWTDSYWAKQRRRCWHRCLWRRCAPLRMRFADTFAEISLICAPLSMPRADDALRTVNIVPKQNY